MANTTLTGTNASYLIGSNTTLTNFGTVGGSNVSIGLTVTGTADTIVNSGTIGGSSYGISAASATNVTNSGTGSLIHAYGAVGIALLLGGGYVTNLSGGTISGYTGVDAGNAPLTLLNAGAISAVQYGVVLSAGGTIVAQYGGTISGGADAAKFAAGFNDRLVIDPGAVFHGSVTGGNAIGAGTVSTLELASGAIAGTLASLGTKYLDFGNITIDSGATWTLTSDTIGSGYTITDAGTLTNTGTIKSEVTLGLYAVLTNAANAVISGSLAGTTGVFVSAGGTLANQSGGTISGGTDAVKFAATYTGRLLDDPGAVFNGTVDGGNTIGATYLTTLELTSGNSTGTLTGLGTKYINFANITIDGGATWTLAADTIGSGYTITDAGTMSNSGSLGSAVTLSKNAVLTNAAFATIAADPLLDAGVSLLSSGTIANLTGGAISGYIGIYDRFDIATVVNAGSILGDQTAFYGTGIALLQGGAISNLTNGMISANTGVYVGPDSTVINAGSIIGNFSSTHGLGVGLGQASYLSNQSSGTISGYIGVFAQHIAATVINAGSISGNQGYHYGDGVDLLQGGYLSNQSLGVISGGYGLYIARGAVAVNAGTILGNPTSRFGTGIGIGIGGSVSNQSTGTISGATGVYAGHARATVVNAGLIAGRNDSVLFVAGRGNRLVVDPGATFSGKADGGNTIGATIASTFELASGATVGTLTGLGSDYVNFAQVTVDAGATWTLASATIDARNTISVHGALTNAGSLGATVYVLTGGTLINPGTATIVNTPTASTGPALAQYGTIINAGLIDNLGSGGLASGVYLQGTAWLTNSVGGTIEGASGVAAIVGAVSTIVNAGTLASTAPATRTGYGIVLQASGSLTNSGLIIAGGTYDFGVVMKTGGVVGNTVGGTIVGGQEGVDLAGGQGTITNAGSIAGGFYAVRLASSFTNRLIIDPGASFSGAVGGGNTIGSATISTMELASGSGAGTLAAIGSQYVDFAQTTIDTGARWTLTGYSTLAAGATITNAGTLTLSDATLHDAGGLINNGGIVLDPSSMTIASLIGTGSVTIDAGSTLDVQGTISSGETIVFAGSGAYLRLENPGSVAGSVTGFDVGETIDLTGVNPTSVTYASGQLTFGTGDSFPLTLANSGTLQIAASLDGTSLTALCFCAETRIATPAGEIAVEKLSAGDLVLTSSGDARPLVWVGTGRVMVARGHRSAATPVIVRKGALAENVPYYDLRVTKGHSFLIDDVLIPVEFLINHRSILWDDHAQEVTLYHLELATHDVLVANGAPAESYRDDGNRWLFENANTGWDQPAKPPCAPVLTGGPIVDAIWRRLLARTNPGPGLPLTDEPDLHLMVDGVRVFPKRQASGYFEFELWRRPNEVRIVSRAGSPEELRLSRDPRPLGVAIRQIRLWHGVRPRVIEASDADLIRGFHAYESDNGFRWTNGNALVPASLFAGTEGTCRLELLVAGTTHYPLLEEARNRVAA